MKMTLPNKLNAFISEMLQDLETHDFLENISESVKVEEIEHESRDGFMPFTNGGYIVSVLSDMGTATGSGCYPEKLTAEVERLQTMCTQDCLESMQEGNKDLLLRKFKLCDLDKPSEINYHTLYESGLSELAEELSELENEWYNEGTTFSYNIRVMYYAADNFKNVTGEDEVLFLSGVNTDYDYLRDSGLDVYFEKCIKVQDLNEDIIKDVILDALNAIK